MKIKNTTTFVYDSLFLEHDLPGHPESSERLIVIIRELKRQKLLERMYRLHSCEVNLDDLLLCHSPEHISVIKGETGVLNGPIGPDAFINPSSWKCASQAAGSMVKLSSKVATGEILNGFAFVRPPGHHALKNSAMGFCLFNNVAIAAKSLLRNKLAKKVAIVDFDVHHGNGTQAMTQDDPDILFISSHQYPFYPGTGSKHETGVGKGKGTVINIPLPYHAGDKAAQLVYSEIVLPALCRFQPDIILVSAGYDAHWKDPLAQLLFSASTFTWLSQKLVAISEELCQGKIVFALEGGYHLQAMAESAANSIKALLGKTDFIDNVGESPYPESDMGGLIEELKKLHSL